MPDELSSELKAAIRKEAVSQSSKWVIGGVVALLALAAAGWWLALKPRLSAELGVLPVGAVVAFNEESGCPTGWRTYEQAAGRVIIGVRDKNHNNLPIRKWRDTGGTQLHISKADLDTGDLTTGGVLYKRGGYGEHVGLEPGGGDSVTLMPPYVVLHYCLKVSGPESG